MKKSGFLLLLLFIAGFSASAQLEDTKWRNTVNIPDPVECMFHFKKDTVNLYVVADGSLIESMTYKISKDTLKLTKVSGMSPCSEVVGLYKMERKDDKLFITAINDECSERSSAFRPDAWIKEK